jgi:hypothetical protein
MTERQPPGRARRSGPRPMIPALLIAGAGLAILTLAALMLWAYTDAPTRYTAEGPTAARTSVTGSADGTGGAVSPAQDSGLPSGSAPSPTAGAGAADR